MENNVKAIVLFSGGLDSTTALAISQSQNFQPIALTINYQQRHKYEIQASKRILTDYKNIDHFIFDLDLTRIGGSALTDHDIDIPSKRGDDIPVTYVPARNTIFLSIASAYAEKLDISDIFMGVNAIDYSGYPDCRPEFIKSFENTINLATKTGIEGKGIRIHTPLIDLKKSEIIQKGLSLGVDYSKTISCYNPSDDGDACGKCDSCHYRKEGFNEAGVPDPTKYKK